MCFSGPPAQVEDLLATCRVRPLVNQVELHPLCAQRKLVGVCFRHGVQCVAHSALGDQVRTRVRRGAWMCPSDQVAGGRRPTAAAHAQALIPRTVMNIGLGATRCVCRTVLTESWRL